MMNANEMNDVEFEGLLQEHLQTVDELSYTVVDKATGRTVKRFTLSKPKGSPVPWTDVWHTEALEWFFRFKTAQAETLWIDGIEVRMSDCLLCFDSVEFSKLYGNPYVTFSQDFVVDMGRLSPDSPQGRLDTSTARYQLFPRGIRQGLPTRSMNG